MPIKYGTIGSGWITDSWITAASSSGKWTLHSIYSRRDEQAKAFGSKHNCSNTYTSLEQFAADKHLQAVYVASPNSHHYDHAKQMLRAKKHVILEKPATSTVAELEDLFRIAEEEAVVLIEAFRHIQEANFKILQKAITEEHKLGRIYGASFSYASYSSRYTNVLDGETPNIFSLEFSGGSLVDVGVYPVCFAVALFGKPRSEVYAPFICKTGVDGGGVIVLRYDGFGVQINNSKGYSSSAQNEVYGENGTITINASTDISTLKHWDPRTKETEELARPYKAPDKPNVNMEEEAVEFARIIEEKDTEAAKELEEISKIVIGITTDLRRQNGIVYPADKQR